MIATAWSNGSPNNRTGSGYGIRITQIERDVHFNKEWLSVTIQIEGSYEADISISKSFWRSCIELRSASIGRYFLNNELAPWKKGYPLRLELEPLDTRRFLLKS